MPFTIDPARSKVTIDATSSVHPIHTETTGLGGWIDLDAGRGHIELAVVELRSGNPLEDAELRRRVDARRYPTITGEVVDVQRAVEDDRVWLVTGDVTFRGVTRRHQGIVTVTVTESTTEIRITGSATFDVRDFGMEPPRILLLRVHPEVRVAIDVVATAT